MLKLAGWYKVNIVGSHHQFKHPSKKACRLNLLTKTSLEKHLIALKDSRGYYSGSPGTLFQIIGGII